MNFSIHKIAECLKSRRPTSMIIYEPMMELEQRKKEFDQWLKAVKRAKGWAHM